MNVPNWKPPSCPSTDECVNKWMHLFRGQLKEMSYQGIINVDRP